MNHDAKFTLFTGIAGSGKTAALLDLYRDALAQAQQRGRPGSTLWLAPTNRVRAETRNRLLNDSLKAAFRPNLFTFDQFADEVLKGAPEAVQPCSSAMQRVLLRRVVARLVRDRQLNHFGKIALTSGFLDLVTSFISELKRGETWPEHFADACQRRGNRAGDRELVLIYKHYQESLVAANLYDGEGRFWSARAALESGHWGRFGELTLAVVDGFTDFTEAQYKILELLARRVDRLCVSLLWDDGETGRELFAKTAAVINRFKILGGTEIRASSPTPRDKPSANRTQPPLPPAIAHIAANLFTNPREVVRSSDASGIEVVAVAGSLGEVRSIAARVKGLLLQGVSPADIVVAVRDLDEYAVLVDEVFTAAGLSYACETGQSCRHLPAVKALFNLLRLEMEDWPYGRLMGLLDSCYFRPAWNEIDVRQAARAVSAELRRCQLAEGREGMLATLERIAGQADTGEDALPAETAQLASRLLRRLSDTTAALRRKHDLAGWSGVIGHLVRELGLDGARLDEKADDTGRTFGSFLTSLLFDAARGEPIAERGAAPLSLAEFMAELSDVLENQRLPPRTGEVGRVRVLNAEQVRNLDVPYLFLAGLSETSFPRHRGDDCLYGEGDRQELNECGLALGHRMLRAQEELLMFYGIVTRARRQLVLTYPVVTDEGQPLSPSPYQSALRDLFGDAALTEQLEERLDPVPERERVLSPADVRVCGMAEALAGRPALFRAVCENQPAARHTLSAVEMNMRRFETPGFTNYEGVLENPQNIAAIQQAFSAGHEFSATQLEGYAACPFRFLISQVLALEPPDVPGVATDFAKRGSLVHDVLAQLHRELFPGNTEGDKTIPRGEDVATTFQRLLEAKLKSRPAPGPVHEALQRIEHRLLAEWAEAYGRQWNDYCQTLPRGATRPPLPALFEISFGASGAAAESTPANEPAGAADKGHGRTAGNSIAPALPALLVGTGESAVRVGGRIDRIDVGLVEGRTVFTVIDYKTGRNANARIDTVETGRRLQLALYALAVLRLDIAAPAGRPWQMGYWYIRDTGFATWFKKKGRGTGDEQLPPIEEAVWTALIGTLEAKIPQLAAGIRRGSFAVENIDDDCTSGCAYRTICRVAQVRALPEALGKFSEP
ncbi:MAG: exodeoxyribonuclease V subunit gamma [Planctomycetia bacterium]|nr:exodeoxyribonuclease V subunit gamma [Planctomycetia bacterium]